CGCGAASACGVRFSGADGEEFIPVGRTLSRVSRIDASGLDARISSADITVICDVDNQLFGERGAARVFAPQKGADGKTVELLDEGARSVASVIKRDLGIDVSNIPGGGAAGGCGAGAVAFFGAKLRRGIDAILDAVDFDSLISGSDLIVTGEGKFGGTSADGKAVSGVAARASRRGSPVAVVCGIAEDGAEALIPGIKGVFPASRGVPPAVIAPEDAEKALYKTAREMIKLTLL
ncbi:MAG: glycerate kinase, partial [Clostridia bacterium]|nr:glycerate kinase [Clostridia bacterium]